MSYDFKPGDIVINRHGAVHLVCADSSILLLHGDKFKQVRTNSQALYSGGTYSCAGNLSGLCDKILELPHAKAILQGNANI